MFKKKCPGCGKKIEKSFSYCPYCGMSFRQKEDEENFGFLGRDDFMPEFEKEINQGFKLPFGFGGFDKIISSLMKQIEKDLGEMGNNTNVKPRGFRIEISTGRPKIKQVAQSTNPSQRLVISDGEIERRRKLPKEEAESNIRRLSDRIVYEVDVPGVKSKEDIIVTKLEDSIEIRAYSKNKCFYKIIPLRVEVIGYRLKDDKLVLELKD